jgi:hypothetical protein
MQALAKDLPWQLKDSRVSEILEAVSISPNRWEIRNYQATLNPPSAIQHLYIAVLFFGL